MIFRGRTLFTRTFRVTSEEVKTREEDQGHEDNFKVGETVLQKNIRQEE